ncbi:hypothetical protein CRG98_019166 [Punica granatum]|uniref:Uncharacterized protein n=1 Tax=Punica granatum TaxID=22663 RepID=A0A2I0JVW6_PUNGR|nr:hypothetical protein CRG98_019166 [Punica granatum]
MSVEKPREKTFALVLLATLPSLLTRAISLSCLANSPSLLARASYNLAGSAHSYEFTFMLRKFTEPARRWFLQPSRPSLLARASFDLAGSAQPYKLSFMLRKFIGSAQPCEFTFMLRNLAESACSCFFRPCRVCSAVQAFFYASQVYWVCSAVRVYFHASQLSRVCLLVLLSTLPGLLSRTSFLLCFASLLGLLSRASLLSCFTSTLSLLARASCNLAESANPCDFTFMPRKFAEPARSPLAIMPGLLTLSRTCSLELLATLPGLLSRTSFLLCFASLLGLLSRASLLSCFTSTLSLLARASCNLASSPSLLARASCNLAGSAHPCEFTLMFRKFVEPARSCFLQPCRVCSQVLVHFQASQARLACSLVLLATLPGLLTSASSLSSFASSPSLLARASCNLVGSTHPCEYTYMLRKFTEPTGSCLLKPCKVCSHVRVYFHASQLSRVCSARASFELAGSAHPCEFTFMPCKFAEPARTPLVCSLVRVYFHASQLSRAYSLVLLATLLGLLTLASILTCFASSPSLLARTSCNLARSAHSCEFTFMLRNLAESACSCFFRPCRVCSPVRVHFHAAQVRRACSLASCNHAGTGHPCEFTLMLRKFAEPARSCFLQPCWVYSPLRVYLHASQVRRAYWHLAEPARSCFLQPCRVCSPVRVHFDVSQVRRARSLVLLATLLGLLTLASILTCFASSPSLLARASCNLVRSAHPCEFTLMLRNLAEPIRSCFLQPCRACSPVPVHFQASQARLACSLMLLATLLGLLTLASILTCFASSPSLLARASCNLVRSAHPCEFTLMLRNLAEPIRSCFLQPCRACSPVPVHFQASQARLACSLMLLATLLGLLTLASILTCFASSPSLLARASCNLVRSAHPCEFTLMLRNLAEPIRSCFLQPCRACSPVPVHFQASQARLACSLMLLATLLGLLTLASILTCFASSPSLLARASCNLVRSAHPCEFTLMLRNLAEPIRSCFLQPCRACSPVPVHFQASQARLACSLMLLATLLGLLTLASILTCFASSPILLARASCNLARSANPCEFTFMLRNLVEFARSCLF